jgi:hypothetical protein
MLLKEIRFSSFLQIKAEKKRQVDILTKGL